MTDAGFRLRVLIMAALLAGGFTGVAGRLVWLQVVRQGDLAQLAERQYSRTVVLHAQRGPIVDRHGAALATSTAAESLFANPRTVSDPGRVAAGLSAGPEACSGNRTGGALRARPRTLLDRKPVRLVGVGWGFEFGLREWGLRPRDLHSAPAGSCLGPRGHAPR